MLKILLTLLIFTTNALALESRIKIVVLDTGISRFQVNKPYMCENGVWTSFKDNGLDYQGHGTNIVGIIAKDLDYAKYCILSIKVFSAKTTGTVNGEYIFAGLRAAIRINPAWVNLSMAGDDSWDTEYQLLTRLLRNGSAIAVAAGNNKKLLSKYFCFTYPACYKRKFPAYLAKNFNVIASNDFGNSNYGDIVDAYLAGRQIGFPAMTGTSQSTALFVSKMISP